MKKYFNVLCMLVIAAMLFGVLPAHQVSAASVKTVCASGCDFTTIQAAIDDPSVVAGDVIEVQAGTYDTAATIIVNKAITLTGTGTPVVRATGGLLTSLEITSSNVTVQGFTFTVESVPVLNLTGWTELANSLVRVPISGGLTGIVFTGNTIFVPAQDPPMSNWNGVGLTIGTAGASGIVITNNTIYNTRDGIVVQYNVSATLTGNVIYDTKGGIMNYTGTLDDARARVMTNNSWGTTHNEWDIVWNSGGGPYVSDYQETVLGVSEANNDAYTVSLMTTTETKPTLVGNRSHVFVNGATGTTTKIWSNGNFNLPYATIALGVEAVVPGGTVYVAEGTYTGQVTINKRLSLLGAGTDKTIITGGNPALLLSASGTVDQPITLKDVQIAGPSGIRTAVTPVDYVTLDNVWLFASPVKSGEGFRIVTGHQMTHLTIVNSTIEGFIDGVIVEKTPGTGAAGTKLQYVTVTDTLFKDNYRKGLYVETLSDAIFTNVQLQGNGYVNPGTNLAEYNSAGFDLNLKDGTYSNLQFINMTATGNGLKAKDGAALMIKARSDGASYGAYPATLDNVLVSGGSFTGNERGIRFGEPNKDNAGPTNVVIDHVQVYGNVKTYTGSDGSAYGDVVNYALASVDASPNWWGSIAGPQAGQIVGSVVSDPWCADAACTTTMTYAGGIVTVPSGTSAADIQALIDGAPYGTTIILPGEAIPAYTGGFIVGRPGIKIKLQPGAIIKNNSPCFTINADDVIIEGYGATCVPTAGSDGIVIGTGSDQVAILGLEIDGTGETTDDGIALDGDHTDLQLLDMYIHNLGGDGIDFGTGVYSGTFDVAGNYLKANAGYDMAYAGTGPLKVEYNNFDLSTDPAGEISGSLDYTPWTYAALSMVSSGSPALNKVAVGENITYTISLDPQQVYGAEFDLVIPSNLSVVSISCNTVWDGCTVPSSPYTNTLHFYGYEGAGFNSPTVVYTVELQGVTAGADLVLDLDDTDDKFATFMLGPTNMLYGNALTDGTVTVYGKQLVQGKVTLQGRADNSGALLTFTPGTLMGYSYSGTSNYWGNISLANVVDDTYPITIDKANYLAVTANSLKSVAISSSKTSLTTIMLLGGNVTGPMGVVDEAINLLDASAIGGSFNLPGPYDVNGNGLVDIFDLTLVGGNYGLTSATAYSWVP